MADIHEEDFFDAFEGTPTQSPHTTLERTDCTVPLSNRSITTGIPVYTSSSSPARGRSSHISLGVSPESSSYLDQVCSSATTHPSRSNALQENSKLKKVIDNLEEEENQLLVWKQLQEERRRQEDAEMASKLQEIKAKRIIHERQYEQERKVGQLRERRQKLESIRYIMSSREQGLFEPGEELGSRGSALKRDSFRTGRSDSVRFELPRLEAEESNQNGSDEVSQADVINSVVQEIEHRTLLSQQTGYSDCDTISRKKTRSLDRERSFGREDSSTPVASVKARSLESRKTDEKFYTPTVLTELRHAAMPVEMRQAAVTDLNLSAVDHPSVSGLSSGQTESLTPDIVQSNRPFCLGPDTSNRLSASSTSFTSFSSSTEDDTVDESSIAGASSTPFSAGQSTSLPWSGIRDKRRRGSGKEKVCDDSAISVPADVLERSKSLDIEAKRLQNPLNVQMMKRNQQFSGEGLNTPVESDGESETSSSIGGTLQQNMKHKGIKLKKFLGKKVDQFKNFADEVLHGEETDSENEEIFDGKKRFRFKSARGNKGPYVFNQPKLVQDFTGTHAGAIWAMKFSICGQLLATGGQDQLIRVWVLKDAYSNFNEMREHYQGSADVAVSDSDSDESDASSTQPPSTVHDSEITSSSVDTMTPQQLRRCPFRKEPLCVYRGHEADILDLAWSKNYFLLSSSMDKTVRLWHISRTNSLCCFQHIDFVTAIAFHPKDDTYFLSGSMDGKMRLWSIPAKKVASWNEVPNGQIITAAAFCSQGSNQGKYAVVGTYTGNCVFYDTEQRLKYFTTIPVKSTRGRNSRGSKITAIEALPGEEKLLITSNDSRIRLYDLRDFSLTCKYRGFTNNSSQIGARFNHSGDYIVSGSEDQFIYFWRTQHDTTKFARARRDRNMYWEAIKAHDAVTTVAMFAPCPWLFFKSKRKQPVGAADGSDQKKNTRAAAQSSGTGSMWETQGEVFVTADFVGALKVFKVKFNINV